MTMYLMMSKSSVSHPFDVNELEGHLLKDM